MDPPRTGSAKADGSPPQLPPRLRSRSSPVESRGLSPRAARQLRPGQSPGPAGTFEDCSEDPSKERPRFLHVGRVRFRRGICSRLFAGVDEISDWLPVRRLGTTAAESWCRTDEGL